MKSIFVMQRWPYCACMHVVCIVVLLCMHACGMYCVVLLCMHGMYCGLIVHAWYVLWSYCASMVCIVVLLCMHACGMYCGLIVHALLCRVMGPTVYEG